MQELELEDVQVRQRGEQAEQAPEEVMKYPFKQVQVPELRVANDLQEVHWFELGPKQDPQVE